MLIGPVIEESLVLAFRVTSGYAAYAALILLMISVVGSLPVKRRDGFRAASRVAALVVASAGLLLLATYLLKELIAVQTGNRYEQWSFVSRAPGPYARLAWVAALSMTLLPQLLWLMWVRRRTTATALVAAFALTGHAVTFIVFRIATATRDRLPSSWDELPSVLF